jgi:hypothetical protein
MDTKSVLRSSIPSHNNRGGGGAITPPNVFRDSLANIRRATFRRLNLSAHTGLSRLSHTSGRIMIRRYSELEESTPKSKLVENAGLQRAEGRTVEHARRSCPLFVPPKLTQAAPCHPNLAKPCPSAPERNPIQPCAQARRHSLT